MRPELQMKNTFQIILRKRVIWQLSFTTLIRNYFTKCILFIALVIIIIIIKTVEVECSIVGDHVLQN